MDEGQQVEYEQRCAADTLNNAQNSLGQTRMSDYYQKQQEERLAVESRVAALQIAIQFVHTQTCYDCDSLIKDATAILDFIKKGHISYAN